MKPDILPIFMRCPLADGMSQQEAEDILYSSEASLLYLQKDEIIFSEGDMPKCLYVLLAGEVRLMKSTLSGRQIFVESVTEPGDMLGEIYFALQHPYDIYGQAADKTQLLAIAHSWLSLDESDSSRAAMRLRLNLLRAFAGKAYFMHNKIKVLASGSLREKIVRLLFQYLSTGGEVELTVSREYLAAYLAVARPSLSRELGNMQREGILSIKGRQIKVLDMARFESYL